MVPHCHELRFLSGCHTKLVQPLKLLLLAVNNLPVSPNGTKVLDLTHSSVLPTVPLMLKFTERRRFARLSRTASALEKVPFLF
jgi:hypothetical protein